MIDALAYGGVNRVSLGVQSFDPVVQRAIHRVQSFDQTAAATANLRRAGIHSVNFDLIYGLPHQAVTSCLDTVLNASNFVPIASRFRLCARPDIQEASAQDTTRRGSPTASNATSSPMR